MMQRSLLGCVVGRVAIGRRGSQQPRVAEVGSEAQDHYSLEGLQRSIHSHSRRLQREPDDAHSELTVARKGPIDPPALLLALLRLD